MCSVRENRLNTSQQLQSTYSWTCANGKRSLIAKGIPGHVVGAFPNANNPNKVSAQQVSFSVTLRPAIRQGSGATVKEPGYAINGVKFDPGTGGACPSNMNSTGACDLGQPADRPPTQLVPILAQWASTLAVVLLLWQVSMSASRSASSCLSVY